MRVKYLIVVIASVLITTLAIGQDAKKVYKHRKNSKMSRNIKKDTSTNSVVKIHPKTMSKKNPARGEGGPAKRNQ